MKREEKVKQWLQEFGIEYTDKVDTGLFSRGLRLIFEELQETALAGGSDVHHNFMDEVSGITKEWEATKDHAKHLTSFDEIAVRDGIADLQVVIHNVSFAARIIDKVDKDFEAVMESNFSKICKTEEEAKETVRLYGEGLHPDKMGVKLITYYVKVENYSEDRKSISITYVVKNMEYKILKSMNYKKPVFT